MFIDFRTLDEGAQIDADLCIIGAGAAGIAIAREFIDAPVRLCLLESGGLEFDDDTQALYQGENIGLPYDDLDVARLRYFGGTTNHWAGACAPFHEHSFAGRPWLPYSGWPISLADLEPSYRRAQAVLELGPYRYDSSVWRDLAMEPPGFDAAAIAVQFFQWSPPTRFGEAYRDALREAQNIQVLLHANCTSIQTADPPSTVRHLQVRSLTGNAAIVRARHYVLACGGIENARLLLNSNDVESMGVGNHYDVVGRFFMEHPHVECATVAGDGMADLLGTFSRAQVDGIEYRANPSTSLQRQLREQSLSCTALAYAAGHEDDGIAAAKDMLRALRQVEVPDDFFTKAGRIIGDIDDVVAYAYRRLVEGRDYRDGVDAILLLAQSEQGPNPDSRVTLSPERDALGLNRVRLDWRLTDLDRHSIRVMVSALGDELSRLGLGRLTPRAWLADDSTSWHATLRGGGHHMGTTRMAEDPRHGVVDADCRVHGIENLHVAGSSVFATCDHVNPTLTIVALSLRLADRLRELLDV